MVKNTFMLASNMQRSAVSARFHTSSFDLAHCDHYDFAYQIVEISFHMGQQLFCFQIAVSNALAIRVRLVVLVIALTCTGVVLRPCKGCSYAVLKPRIPYLDLCCLDV